MLREISILSLPFEFADAPSVLLQISFADESNINSHRWYPPVILGTGAQAVTSSAAR